MTTVYVPRDSSARSVGADQVVAAIELEAARLGAPVEVVRNGSRGMMWLEPLVEVVSARGRVSYGPVTPDDVAGLFAAGFLDGDTHELGQGLTDQIPWLAEQDRLTFSRVGVIDPLSTQDYLSHGGLFALRRSLAMTPQQICDEVTQSGLPEVRDLQRRRGRQRDIRGPDAHGGRPLHAHRGDGHRRDRRGRPRGLHLHPLGVPRRGRDDARSHRDGIPGWLARFANPGQRARVRPGDPRRRGRLHLR